jgi:hypothetical protein
MIVAIMAIMAAFDSLETIGGRGVWCGPRGAVCGAVAGQVTLVAGQVSTYDGGGRARGPCRGV